MEPLRIEVQSVKKRNQTVISAFSPPANVELLTQFYLRSKADNSAILKNRNGKPWQTPPNGLYAVIGALACEDNDQRVKV